MEMVGLAWKVWVRGWRGVVLDLGDCGRHNCRQGLNRGGVQHLGEGTTNDQADGRAVPLGPRPWLGVWGQWVGIEGVKGAALVQVSLSLGFSFRRQSSYCVVGSLFFCSISP